MNLSQLPGYRTGGTIHIVVNNQIGFTTAPSDGRSTRYCTDVAKMIEVPIFHVNGEDPEAVVFVGELALDFRQTFGKDVVIDMVCYRRHGHNEGDEPAFTQPLMYEKIKNRISIRELYTEQLVMAGELDQQRGRDDRRDVRRQDAGGARGGPARGRRAGRRPPRLRRRLGRPRPQVSRSSRSRRASPYETLRQITEQRSRRLPPGFTVNPKLARLLSAPREDDGGQGDARLGVRRDAGVRLAALAKTPRSGLSGQDSRRGTFSQRHAVLVDMKTGERYTPLNHLKDDQPEFCVYDSLLSEAAVLGFDYGYSLDEPHMLIMWEAQFGDFANGAQVIIDQFIASAESKWGRGQRPGHALAPRLRGAGARAFERPARAVPPALRRGQHPGRGADHAGAVFPPAAGARCAATSASP